MVKFVSKWLQALQTPPCNKQNVQHSSRPAKRILILLLDGLDFEEVHIKKSRPKSDGSARRPF